MERHRKYFPWDHDKKTYMHLMCIPLYLEVYMPHLKKWARWDKSQNVQLEFWNIVTACVKGQGKRGDWSVTLRRSILLQLLQVTVAFQNSGKDICS